MWITVSSVYSKLTRATEDERAWLQSYLTFEGKRRGRNDGVATCLLNIFSQTFPSGFNSMIKKAAAEDGHPVEFIDNRVAPCVLDPNADLAWLRDYQVKAVEVAARRGRGILWLPTGCLAGDTKLVINRGGAARAYELRTVVRRLAGETTTNRAGKPCAWDLTIPTFTQSVDPEGFVRKNRIERGWCNGIAEVFEVVTDGGRVLRATKDHRFLTPGGFARLHELRAGDEAMVTLWPGSVAPPRRQQYVQQGHMFAHPFAQISNTSRDGRLARVPLHRLIAEARENRVSLAELVGRLVLEETDGLTFLDPEVWHVHHRDGDARNNAPSNLEVLGAKEHLATMLREGGWKHVAGRAAPERIRSITRIGEEKTFDLQMAGPMHNYVANEVVVHNSGKCLAPDTLVLRADGNRIRADEVRAGDRLMGPDSRPRCVLGVSRGRGEMFRIVPNKGEPWVCNDVHVLSLVDSATGTVEDVPLDVYLRRSAAWRHTRKLFQPGPVTFDDAATDVPIDPYFLGVWYGDGRSPNALLERMREVVLPGRLPPRYLTASLEIRRALLAGLLDTDGHLSKGTHFELVQKSESLIDDVAFLARSLGLRVTKRPKVVNDVVYWRLFILGDASALPLRIPRKLPRALPTGPKVKDKRRVGFFVEALGEGDYAGFTLDGDGRFLLGDFTVTHNTEIIVGITRALPCRWLALVHRSQLADDIAARYEKRSTGLVAGRILEGTWDVPDDAVLVSATYQSMRAALEHKSEWKRNRAKELMASAQGLFVDEVHTAPAETYLALLMQTKNAYYRFGLSGTPLARSDAKSQFAIAAIGPVVYRIKPQLLIDRGVLAKPTVRMADVFQQCSGVHGWPAVYRKLVVRSNARNARVIKYAVKAAKPGFIFVEQTEHGRQLVKDLFNAGLKAEFVWGQHSLDYRKSLIRRMVLGHFDVLVCSRVFNEGIDVPELRSVVNAGGMKSIIATLQRLGRGMRVDRDAEGAVREGGDVFEVYDILDTGQKWLEEHAFIRQSAYSNDGYELFIDAQDPIDAMKKRRKKSVVAAED